MNLTDFLLEKGTLMKDALECLNRNGKGIVLVVDSSRCLLGTVTDGDIRRGLLAGRTLETPVELLMNAKPIFLTRDMTDASANSVLQVSKLRQIPVVDQAGKILDLRFADDNTLLDLPSVRAVIMAGGLGRRLWPLTKTVPKPLLKIGEETIIEGIIKRLAAQGFHHITISTGFEGQQIKQHLQDGASWNISIDYLEENEPLGTLGALGHLRGQVKEDLILVTNADLLTSIDYVAMVRFHKQHNCDFTIAVRSLQYEIPYGIVKLDHDSVLSLVEKPTYLFNINAGIYLFQSKLLNEIEPNQYLDAPDFIKNSILDKKRHGKAFLVTEYWIDVGRPEELEAAREQLDPNGKL